MLLRSGGTPSQTPATDKIGVMPNLRAIIDGHVMNSGAVVESLLRIFHDQKISQKDVAIGVYGQSVIVRKITVPMMTEAELEEQIGRLPAGETAEQIESIRNIEKSLGLIKKHLETKP